MLQSPATTIQALAGKLALDEIDQVVRFGIATADVVTPAAGFEVNADDVEVIGARKVNPGPGKSAVVYAGVHVLPGAAADDRLAADDAVGNVVAGPLVSR